MNKIILMKNLTGIIMLIVFIFSAGCEKTEEISGDSSLKIINDCTYSVKIYFDDTNIGYISSEDEKIWSVPSGNHNIKATCSFANDYEDDFNFVAGMTTTIRLELQNKSQQALVLHAIVLSPLPCME